MKKVVLGKKPALVVAALFVLSVLGSFLLFKPSSQAPLVLEQVASQKDGDSVNVSQSTIPDASDSTSNLPSGATSLDPGSLGSDSTSVLPNSFATAPIGASKGGSSIGFAPKQTFASCEEMFRNNVFSLRAGDPRFSPNLDKNHNLIACDEPSAKPSPLVPAPAATSAPATSAPATSAPATSAPATSAPATSKPSPTVPFKPPVAASKPATPKAPAPKAPTSPTKPPAPKVSGSPPKVNAPSPNTKPSPTSKPTSKPAPLAYKAPSISAPSFTCVRDNDSFVAAASITLTNGVYLDYVPGTVSLPHGFGNGTNTLTVKNSKTFSVDSLPVEYVLIPLEKTLYSPDSLSSYQVLAGDVRLPVALCS